MRTIVRLLDYGVSLLRPKGKPETSPKAIGKPWKREKDRLRPRQQRPATSDFISLQSSKRATWTELSPLQSPQSPPFHFSSSHARDTASISLFSSSLAFFPLSTPARAFSSPLFKPPLPPSPHFPILFQAFFPTSTSVGSFTLCASVLSIYTYSYT
ncbi:hypothetical protein BJY04DRAFT_70691 [Aspergillus karnatakaensis]|uniref:uncharacterized protein n=1 Tax=Aspergillus karnatakaensis TaxID=1810916 RepID=UPI003CCD7412